MNFGLIIVGDEILSGKRAGQAPAQGHRAAGARAAWRCRWARYVGDDRARITADLRARLRQRRRGVLAAAASAPRPTTTRASARPRRSACRWRCTRRRATLILERMRDVARRAGRALRARPRRQRAPAEHGRVSRGRARSSPTRTTRSPASSVGDVHFVPGFPVMAWPMIEWVLDHRYAAPARQRAQRERSVIVFGAMEATLTPLMEDIEARFAGVKVFSLPSVDHPQWGRHIELGVKGGADRWTRPIAALLRRPGAAMAPSLAPNWCVESPNRAHRMVRTDAPGARCRRSSAERLGAPAQRAGRGHAFCYIAVRLFGAADAVAPPQLTPRIPPIQQAPARRYLMAQDRRRRDEDGEGQRSQVRRLPLHRHPRQGAARHRARVRISTKTSSPPATPSTVRRSPAGRASKPPTCC